MFLNRKYRPDLFVLVAYIFLAILLTFPLILHFGTHVPGDGSDDPALVWNLWWVPYSILQLHSSPIYTDHMFYPIGLNLAFYTLTYLNAFLSIPIQFAFNLVAAANVNLLLSFALSGFGTYLLVRYLFRSEKLEVGNWWLSLAAFVAGAVYAFSSNKFLYASLGQFNIASSQWIPFYALFLFKWARARDARAALRYGILVGLFLLLQALSEFIFASFLIVFTILFLIYWTLAHRHELSALAGRAIGLLVGAVVFVVPMSPILWAMVQDMIVEGDYIQSGLGFADAFSSDVLGFFVPSHLHPLWGGLESQFHFSYINFAFLGYVALVLAVLALWKIPQARLWGLLGAIFVLITLGPALRVNGGTIPAPLLPFNFLLDIPFVKGNRYPSRWSVMVTLCLAVLVGYAVLWLSRRLNLHNRKNQGLVLLACLPVVLFEHLSALPLSDFAIPEVYQTIAQDNGDFSVLELPLGWRNGFRVTGTLDREIMFEQWYQTLHEHPMLGGNTSRNPELKFQYFTEAPVINSLIAVETGHTLPAGTRERDRQLAGQVLRFLGVRYIVWHSPRAAENQAALVATRQYVENTLPVAKFYDQTDETGATVGYRVIDNAAAGSTDIRVDNPWARLFFAEGWGAIDGAPAWATRREAKLFLFQGSAPPSSAALAFRLFAPMADQTARVVINGNSTGHLKLSSGWDAYQLPIRDGVLHPGVNTILLQFDKLVPAGSVREGSRAIGKTGVTLPAALVVQSAGNEIGDLAHVYVNGVDAALNGVGYNIVVIHPQTGAVEASQSFNTFASEAESTRMAQFIGEIPNGKIVAAAVRDEASRHLTAAAVEALRSLGATESFQGKWRWSHALVGVKGAAPGTALEAMSEILPAQVVVGMGATEPNVAAALEWVRVTPP